jgi:hypothetical protein
MERGPLDLLVYALVFVGIVLVNYLLQRFARRGQQVPVPELPREEGDEAETPPESLWGRAPQAVTAMPERAGRMAPASAAAAGAGRRTRAEALFRSREDIRRAVVVMTVLGPCRAQEPPR